MITDTLGPTLSVLSGALVTLLGVALAIPRPRPAHRLAFSAFSILWGAHIIFGNLSRLSDSSAEATRWTFLYLAPLTVLYVPLVYFIAVFPQKRGLVGRKPLAAALMLTPAALGALALILRPDWFHEGFGPDGTDRWGPLFPLFIAFFFLALDATLLTLSGISAGSTSVIERRRSLTVLAALAVFVSYTSFESLFLFGIPLFQDASGSTWQDAVFLLLAVIGVGTVGLAFWRVRRAHHADDPWARPKVAAAALVLPGVFGVLSGVTLSFPSLPAIETLGLWRTASVVLIAYAILRFELFDIDARVKRTALIASVLAASALVALALEQGLERIVGSTGIAITLTQFALVGAVTIILVKSPVAARALGRRVLPALDAPRRLDERRLEVYEAALGHARAAGTHGELPALRERLGVSDAEHALLERLVAGAPHAPSAAQGPGAGALVGERYCLERLLGEGSLGAAWLARDEQNGKHRVVKVLHARHAGSDAAQRAFLREARLAARLDHPNVVRVLDFGYAGATPFLTMEVAEGGSLEDHLQQHGALPAAQARKLLEETLAGLAHVHAQRILHRDLKPANILLSSSGTARITDFGIAQAAGVDDTQSGLEPARPRGTLATMSPEALRGLPLSPESDLYAAGAVLYRCLTGRAYLRFEGRTWEASRASIIADAPLPAPPGTDAALLAVALRALAKRPDERYQSADEMRAALAAPSVSVMVTA